MKFLIKKTVFNRGFKLYFSKKLNEYKKILQMLNIYEIPPVGILNAFMNSGLRKVQFYISLIFTEDVFFQ